MAMPSQVELANLVIDNQDELIHKTTRMALSLGPGGGERLDDRGFAGELSVLASVHVPPGETRPLEAKGYVPVKDPPMGEAVRWISKIGHIASH